jgi:predicted GNAT family N-acyltransferase
MSGTLEPDGIRLLTGDWATLRGAAEPVRRAVFVVEQRFDEALEWDEHDPLSVHAVAYSGSHPIATGRLLPDARIGRMAVLQTHRRGGVGGRVLQALIAIARARGDAAVTLSAQAYVRAFYARHGFEAFGPLYDDEGVPHQSMRLRLA